MAVRICPQSGGRVDSLTGYFADHQCGTGAGQGEGVEPAASARFSGHVQVRGLHGRPRRRPGKQEGGAARQSRSGPAPRHEPRGRKPATTILLVHPLAGGSNGELFAPFHDVLFAVCGWLCGIGAVLRFHEMNWSGRRTGRAARTRRVPRKFRLSHARAVACSPGTSAARTPGTCRGPPKAIPPPRTAHRTTARPGAVPVVRAGTPQGRVIRAGRPRWSGRWVGRGRFR